MLEGSKQERPSLKIHNERHASDSQDSFFLYYSGTIESGDLLGENYVNVKFDIYHGSEWIPLSVDNRLPEETKTGCTQAGCYNTLQNQEIVWNAPFNFAFKSSNLSGWPQMILSVIAPDFLGRSKLLCYGNVHLPSQPG